MTYWTWTWKILEIHYSSRFDFRYNGLGPENCSDNLTGVGMILWYIGIWLKETLGLPYWTWIDYWFYFTLDLDWLNGLIKQRYHTKSMETFLNYL